MEGAAGDARSTARGALGIGGNGKLAITVHNCESGEVARRLAFVEHHLKVLCHGGGNVTLLVALALHTATCQRQVEHAFSDGAGTEGEHTIVIPCGVGGEGEGDVVSLAGIDGELLT